MSTDPATLLKKRVPEAFHAGLATMRRLAEGGDEKSQTKLSALQSEVFGARFVLEGDDADDLYLAVKDGQMTVGGEVPGVATRAALALPKEALDIALDELGEERLNKGLAKLEEGFSRFSVAKIKPVFERLAAENLRFHFVVKDTPDFDEVRVKVAIGSAEPPEKPTFTVTVDFDTFEDIRRGKVKAQAILSKLQITGDSAKAMQLAMELMQQRR